MKQTINLPNYINGEFCNSNSRKIIKSNDNSIELILNYATKWQKESSIETASRIHNKLENIPTEDIIKLIQKSMNNYFTNEKNIDLIVKISGSPKSFIEDGFNYIRSWGRNVDSFVNNIFKKNILYTNSSPTLAILPGNSDQESLYVISQALIAKNATIIRPSSNGIGTLVALEFINEFKKSINDENNKNLEILKNSISIVNSPFDGYIPQFSIDGWNYIAFGNNKTLNDISKEIHSNCTPRKIISYGTGFSHTIVENFNNSTIIEILDSITVNYGNECVSTDVIYVKEDIYNEFISKLSEKSKLYVSKNPFDSDSIGITSEDTINWIKNEMKRTGKINELKIRNENGVLFLNTTIIPLTKYDPTIEYPGPISGVRPFKDLKDLKEIISKDLKYNNMDKNLVTSIYTDSDERFKEILPIINSYTIKRNKPTHHVDLMKPHQGIYLLEELVDKVYLD